MNRPKDTTDLNLLFSKEDFYYILYLKPYLFFMMIEDTNKKNHSQ